MVSHKHTYSLGHIPTAKYWHNVVEDGIHHTAADTGWGKAVWGKLYGQWISGTGIFIYDYERFNGIKLLEIWYWDFDNIEEILLRNCVEGY